MAFRSFRRFKRKPRVTWLHNTGTEYGAQRGIDAGSPGEQFSGFEFVLAISDNGQPRTVEVPLVLDTSIEDTQTGLGLNVVQRQGLNLNEQWGYRLRRIVGKCNIMHFQDALGQNLGATDPVYVKYGFMVRRIEPELGTAFASGIETDLTNRQNVTDPWIFQREHIFGGSGDPLTTPSARELNALYPRFNFETGGVKDGPVLDIKTARTIKQDERLFFDLTVTKLPIQTAGNTFTGTNQALYILFNYRVLATIFSTNASNRRNASR